LVSVTPERAAEVAALDFFDQPHIDIETLDPGPGQSFVDGRLFILVASDHLVVSGDFRFREATLVAYLNDILHRELLPPNVALQLRRIANTNRIRAIETHGAKSICLNAMLCSETIDLFQTEGILVGSRFVRLLRSCVEEDLQCPDPLKKSDLQAVLALKLKGRSTPVERVSLGEVAKRILDNDEDEYAIVLGNDDVIRASELLHSKEINVPERHKQIDHLKLWDEMAQYLSELEASGALEM